MLSHIGWFRLGSYEWLTLPVSSENGQGDVQGTCKTNFQGFIAVRTRLTTIVTNHREPASSFPIVRVISFGFLLLFGPWLAVSKAQLTEIWYTPWNLQLVPEKWWLRDYFALGEACFQEGIYQGRDAMHFIYSKIPSFVETAHFSLTKVRLLKPGFAIYDRVFLMTCFFGEGTPPPRMLASRHPPWWHQLYIFKRGSSLLPSRELTYPFPKALLKMIFLFPRWDVLVSWRINLHVWQSYPRWGNILHYPRHPVMPGE